MPERLYRLIRPYGQAHGGVRDPPRANPGVTFPGIGGRPTPSHPFNAACRSAKLWLFAMGGAVTGMRHLGWVALVAIVGMLTAVPLAAAQMVRDHDREGGLRG